ncbi:MAG: 50S ribosomal protein L10 [Clostridia bacterium]|nr:50S ribosomal protein L10 [Clostridia bacterium]MBR4878446.1 50S ribosomal protein L10 [Clostridia bacterium]
MPNAKVLESKKQIVAELKEKMANAASCVLVDYKGINVADDTKLRKELREAGVEYTVVKNTLVRFAANEIGFEALGEHLNGTTALAISAEDPIAPARILCKYAKTSKTFKVKVGVLEGKVVPESEINAIAELPNKETLVATVLYGFNTPITKLCIALNEIKNKMEAGEAAPVAAEAAAE